MLKKFIRVGTLHVIDTRGRRRTFGTESKPAVTIRMHRGAPHLRLVLNPALWLGEAYVDGKLTIEEGGTIYELLDLLAENKNFFERTEFAKGRKFFARALRSFRQHNPISNSRRNVAHHYDLSDSLFELFLDKDRQYSCGYYESDDSTLEEAQFAKKRHLAAKLLLKSDCRILDIGSGWGGLARYLARAAEVEVTGITLSEEQFKYCESETESQGLADRVRFEMRDYRHCSEVYDRIVSVGMFEHVGVKHYDKFFGQIRNLLADDGVALVHSITRFGPPSVTNPWVRKHIFPGGYIPALSEVFAAIERAGLKVTDMECLRLHYAMTLRHWRENFSARREKAVALYDERFFRLWEFYLALSEAAFRHQNYMVSQIQLTRKQESVPLTRNYIRDWETAHIDVGASSAA